MLNSLAQAGPAARSLWPVQWSDDKKRSLEEAVQSAAPAHDVIPLLLRAQLDCALGRMEEAERDVLALLRENEGSLSPKSKCFIPFLQTLFVLQRFDLVVEMLRWNLAMRGEMAIGIEDAGRHPACVRWEISPSGDQGFLFDASAFRDDKTAHKILHLSWILPMFANYANLADRESGTALINQFDLGVAPGFAFCDNRPEYFLLPDQLFVGSSGYARARKILQENSIPWRDRKPVAFWRGATTGPKVKPGDWRSIARIQLCELANTYKGPNIFDVGLSKIAQIPDPGMQRQIRESGLLRDFVPWQEWGNYKFNIDIDGNSASFSNLIQRLLTGSPVLKVTSPRGLRQWYYDELVPWDNYIPIAPDLSDLVSKVDWLLRHDDYAQKVGLAGQALVARMTYDREIDRSAAIISAGLRESRGGDSTCPPFARWEPSP